MPRLILLFLLLTAPAFAQEGARPERLPEQEPVVTHHEARIGGQAVPYTATAGYLPLHDEDGKHLANVFFVAYTREGVADPTTRPVTFTFNGGPGSSSVWLHLGVAGPRRVEMTERGEPLPPPYRLVDNEHAWLDVTDLVFIDPVMTGYSRPAPEEDRRQFLGYTEDIESVGQFIQTWTTRYGRWGSPKFLAGESYGTTRAAGLAGHLQDRYGMYLNGLVLVSSILNFQTARFHVGNNLPYVLFLPTYTATAHYHGRLEPSLQDDLQATLREVEQFALTDYTLALMQGDALPAAEQRRVAERLARYTGLTPEYVERANLRLDIFRFTKELLRDERRTVGRLDSRFTGIDRDAAGERFEFDPSLDATISGPYATLLNDYLRRELNVENELPYEILTGRVHPWNYSNVQNQYLNVAETLRRAMSVNPGLRVFIASGYYDLATPYFATDYTIRQMQLDPERRDNVEVAYYPAGHMMYIHAPSLEQLTADVRRFIRASVPQ